MQMPFLFMMLFGLCQAGVDNFADTMRAEARLRHDLARKLDDVTRAMRPVTSRNDSVTVEFGLSLIKLHKINADEGTMKALLWLRYLWHDVHLKWDPADFQGIDTLRMDNNQIWKPDITLYSNVKAGVDRDDSVQVVVSKDGRVLWIPPAVLSIPCTQNGTDFQCQYKFGSWVYTGHQLDIEFFNDKASVDTSTWKGDPAWELDGNSAERNVVKYPCCEEPYPDLTFTLTFRAKSTDGDA